MIQRYRFWFIAPAYLRTVARREWPLFILALVGLAPGVAALTAWLSLALHLRDVAGVDSFRGWLLPSILLDLIGAEGVLAGAGAVTLLVGCLGLTNAYLVSLEQRNGELALFTALGLRREQVNVILLLEALVAGLLGSSIGVLLGMLLSWLSWPSAQIYFQIEEGFQIDPLPLIASGVAGVLAALLFMGFAALTSELSSSIVLRGRQSHLPNRWQELRTSIYGALFASIMALLITLPFLNSIITITLSLVALILGGLLSGGSWILTHLYRRLPTPASSPLWTLAVQGLARHPNQTAGMVLALTTGAYSVGLSALTWLNGTVGSLFSFWVAGMLLIAGAILVLTIAALAVFERRSEFTLLMALGARPVRIWRMILLEYALVALGSGTAGALMALVNWIGSGGSGGWPWALGIVIVDISAALIAAWAGAIPILWLVTKRSF